MRKSRRLGLQMLVDEMFEEQIPIDAGDDEGEDGDVPMVRVSCFHGTDWSRAMGDKCAVASSDHIVSLYVSAARRIPVDAMPQLVQCLYFGGHCIGLLDPVSSIIFNALNLLCRWREGSYTPRHTNMFHLDPEEKCTWKALAFESYRGLIAFLQAYFPYLTDAQARRYIYLSGADLAVAIQIAEMERSASLDVSDCHPDLLWDAAQFALIFAATTAKHPSPDDIALLCQPAVQESKDMADVLSKLEEAAHQRLSVDDVEQVVSVLQSQHLKVSSALQVTFPHHRHSTPGCSEPLDYYFSVTGGSITTKFTFQPRAPLCLANMRSSEGIHRRLVTCLADSSNSKYNTRRPIDAPPTCEYIKYLRFCLMDFIHAFYIEALTRLPLNTLQDILPSILVVGHCYGPMDPVSNIILNSIWYKNVVPQLQDSKDATSNVEKPDILGTASIARLELCSLNGLVAAVCAATGLSEHRAVEYLCSRRCDVHRMLQHLIPEQRDRAFYNASEAAKHPLGEGHSKFLTSLASDKPLLDELSSLLRIEEDCSLLDVSIEQSCSLLCQRYSGSLSKLKLPANVAEATSKRAAALLQRRGFLREESEKLLRCYCAQHPWEPKYTLGIICGVEQNSSQLFSHCYHVNFLVSQSDASAFTKTKLFFAQIWKSKHQNEQPYVIGESGISFCVPLPCYSMDSAYLGRCSMCQPGFGKIVHPPSGLHAGAMYTEVDYRVQCMYTSAPKGSSPDDGNMDLELTYWEDRRDHYCAEGS